MNEKTFDLMTTSKDIELTISESAEIKRLSTVYGDSFANNAKAVLKSIKLERKVSVARAMSIYNAIKAYDDNHSNDKTACSNARKAFKNATGINDTDISRSFSIMNNVVAVLQTQVNVYPTFTTNQDVIDTLMQIDYSKLIELAKLRDTELIYIIPWLSNTFSTCSLSECKFLLTAFMQKVTPIGGRELDFSNRVQWLEDNKDIKKYGKDEKAEDNKAEDNKTEDTPITVTSTTATASPSSDIDWNTFIEKLVTDKTFDKFMEFAKLKYSSYKKASKGGTK